jgi:uncharacterized protein
LIPGKKDDILTTSMSKENQSVPLSITKVQARRFLLAYHHLLPGYHLEGKEGILKFIKKVGCIQYDPLNIVGHNSELVLQSRVKDFTREILGELLYKDRDLLDGWDKNMSIYLVEDRPCFERYRKNAREWLGNSDRPAVKILPEVRRLIKEKGPLSSLDLDFDQVVGWSWAPTRVARAALDSMYAWGELIIHHRVHTRKVYDFTVHHIPGEILTQPDPNPGTGDFIDWNVARRIGSVGLLWNKAGGAWLGIRGLKSAERRESIDRLLAAGKIVDIHVQDISVPVYIPHYALPLLRDIQTQKAPPPAAVILAPLDNLLWDRALAEQLFHFEYRWEVYKPVHERKYGYYVLPILYKDRFIARFEPGHDKKNKTLVIKEWWWENDVQQTKTMMKSLEKCFSRFMEYLGVKTLRVETGNIHLSL